MYGGKAEARSKSVNAVVVIGRSVFKGDVDVGPGGGADGVGGGDGRDRDCDGRLVKRGGYCSKNNIRYISQCSPCLCYGIGTPPPDYE